jgi:hypothetical protein
MKWTIAGCGAVILALFVAAFWYTWIFAILCFILAVLLGISVFYLYRTGKIILIMIDTIQEQMDVFDEAYFRIGEILKTPVGTDDPFVRSVIEEIKRVQRSILVVANKLSTDWDPTRKAEEEDDDEDE